MTRCPQKQGFPGVPVGAQTLTRPFRLFSRVCSCPVAPRAGPGSHPPPPRALRDRHPQNTLGSLPASPSLLAPHPTPVYWNLHQHTSTCVAVAFPFVKGRPVLLVPVDQWPTWHFTGSALGFGFGDRDLGQGTSVGSGAPDSGRLRKTPRTSR